MKKILGITFGGLQKRVTLLVLIMLSVALAAFMALSAYQNGMLVSVVEETRDEQQKAISETSEETMYRMLEGTLVRTTVLQAGIADNDFSEVVNNTYMLQTMAQGLFESRDSLAPAAFYLPDPSADGIPSAMVLCEEGVDYTRSEYLGVAAHMSRPMIAMFTNSDKIDGCYIGLADGTDLCVDEKAPDKLDDNGNLIPFPVRERPWYKGAVETGEMYFTGIEEDAFTGKPVITCSAPVTANGETVGVVGVDVVLESMNDFVISSSGQGGFAYVVNNNGQVILASDKNGLFPAETADEAEDLRRSDNKELAQFVEQALRETTELNVITVDHKQYYMAGAPMPTVGWAVISVVEKELTEQPEKQMLAEYDKINGDASAKFRSGTNRTNRSGILLTICVFVGGLCAAMYAASRMVKPIEEMTRDITESSRTGRLFEMKDAYRTNDEIELLAEAFDDLSRKTKRYIENITEITAEKERISTELSLATEIQIGMMPHIFPAFPERTEFDLYAMVNPAKAVGGDFYDYFLIDDDHLCLVMADVSGKGIPAALFMMASKIILASCAMLGKSAAEILTKTNEAICSNNQQEMFVTVWLGILEISTGRLTAANAGHEYPVIKRADGKYELFKDRHGLVIGGIDGVQYKDYELWLKPGDRLFLYTDGVPEASDEENRMFGTERMLAALNGEPDASPKEILKNVRAAVDDFVQDAEQFDDLTMLCLEYKGASGAAK